MVQGAVLLDYLGSVNLPLHLKVILKLERSRDRSIVVKPGPHTAVEQVAASAAIAGRETRRCAPTGSTALQSH